MSTIKEFFGIRPKQPKEETQLPRRRYGTSPEDVAAEKAEVEERRKKDLEKGKKEDEARTVEIEKAKQKFQSEKPKLEHRLWEIPAKIKELEEGLTRMKGPEMRKILDREFELNSALSPIDSTDPKRAREYEEWVRALNDSRAATQELKADLGRRIDKYQKEINGLEEEKRKIEGRIQRGY